MVVAFFTNYLTHRGYVLCEGGGELQQFYELFDAKICLTYDCSECTTVQFFMVRHDKLGERFISPEDHMAPMLATEDETCF